MFFNIVFDWLFFLFVCMYLIFRCLCECCKVLIFTRIFPISLFLLFSIVQLPGGSLLNAKYEPVFYCVFVLWILDGPLYPCVAM